MKYILFILPFILFLSLGYINNNANHIANGATDSINKASVYDDTLNLKCSKKDIYELTKDIDLKGRTFVIPKGIKIKTQRGMFCNGTLVGSSTQIIGQQPLFSRVTIKGSWNVPNITTSMFADLKYDNSLRDVVALADPSVRNRVYISEGDYYISLSSKNKSGMTIPSNTTVIIDGNLKLRPNNLKNYNIISIEKGQNVIIEGSGLIQGDKYTHTGEKGEWGMGINLHGAEKAIIRNLTIKDCWGDCIYIGGNSKDVLVNNCILDHGRRQGVSITYASDVHIKNCVISNVHGTSPQYGIDVEPNANCKVNNVLIEGVVVRDCFGGIKSWRNKKNANIHNVVLQQCKVIGAEAEYPIAMRRADVIEILNCSVDTKSEYSVVVQDVEKLVAKGNDFKSTGNYPIKLVNCKMSNINNEIRYENSYISK